MIDNFTNEEFRKEFTAEEENDFMEFVKEVDAADRWEETPLDSLYLKEIDMTDAPSLIKERTSTGLALITDGEAFPVFPEMPEPAAREQPAVSFGNPFPGFRPACRIFPATV